jgi:hypothetical protein
MPCRTEGQLELKLLPAAPIRATAYSRSSGNSRPRVAPRPICPHGQIGIAAPCRPCIVRSPTGGATKPCRGG